MFCHIVVEPLLSLVGLTFSRLLRPRPRSANILASPAPMSEPELLDLFRREGCELGVAHRPERVAPVAEIFHADRGGRGVGQHLRRPGAEVLDPADLHPRRMHVDPVVGERVGVVDDQRHDEEIVKESLSFAVVLLVASIPLAIEIVTTTTLALGSKSLSAKGAIVTRLGSIEEMAGMDCLCSDKTGTLTLNQVCYLSRNRTNLQRGCSGAFLGEATSCRGLDLV